MKYSITLLAAASAAMAQLESLPACGQTCIQNMIGIATSDFSCAVGDINCYCTNIDFGYGVRDCSNEACQSSEEAAQVISFGTNYCAQALASAGDAASTIVASGLSVLSSAAAEATATGDDDSNGGASSTPVTTSPLESTVTSDGSTYVTTTGLVTLYGPASGAATPTDAAGSASDAASSILSSVTGALESAASSASDAANSAASEASDAAGSATSTGGAPVMTAAPLFAGAGLAALLLI